MKYAIYLDEENVEEFDSNEMVAIQTYKETKEEFLGEEIYTKVRLMKCEVVKEDEL